MDKRDKAVVLIEHHLADAYKYAAKGKLEAARLSLLDIIEVLADLSEKEKSWLLNRFGPQISAVRNVIIRAKRAKDAESD